MKNKVVHCKRASFDVYIGRPSIWGNPFTHRTGTQAKFKVGSRLLAIEAYRHWISTQSDLIERAKRELKNKILGCWCAPDACHGDVLAEIANSSAQLTKKALDKKEKRG